MKKIISLVSVLFAFGAMADSLSPVNPAFIQWQRERQAKRVASATQTVARVQLMSGASVQAGDADEGGTGLMPSPLDLSYLRNLNSGAVKAPTGAGFPVKYDLRAKGLLTSVKNQNPYGTCWAHATCASLESWLLKSEGASNDFSEKNMASVHGFDWGFDDGGNMNIAAAWSVESSLAGVSIGTTGLLSLPACSDTASITVRATFGGRTGEKQIVLLTPPLSTSSDAFNLNFYSDHINGQVDRSHAESRRGD